MDHTVGVFDSRPRHDVTGMMASAQELFHGHDGTSTGLVDWHDGTGR